MHIFYRNCGAKLRNGSQFCANCGQRNNTTILGEEMQSNPIPKKPKRRIGCFVILAFFAVMLITMVIGILVPSKDVKSTAVFEQIGYSKVELESGFKNRSFVFYTTETDESKLIEHARKQMYTPGGETYVHYYNVREKAPDNTFFPEGPNYLLVGYEEGRFLVSQKRPAETEYLWDGEMKQEREITPESN